MSLIIMSDVRIGVDIGGTFTDLVAYDENANIFYNIKVPTTLQPDEGVINALKKVYKKQSIILFSHSTTVATNVLLTRQHWPSVALITTKGYRDVLEIGRQRRQEIYNLKVDRPTPIVPRARRMVVNERISKDGNVVKPLNFSDLEAIIDKIKTEHINVIAVSLINAYKNPVHERKIKKFLQDRLNIPIILSSDIDPMPKEFERTSTTVVNALLYPVVSSYLKKLSKNIIKMVGKVPIYIMQSDGGLNTIDSVIEKPISIIESGPSSGVLASLFFAKMLGIKNMLTFDMGGTTAKAGIIYNNYTHYSFEFEAAGKTHSGRSIKGSGYVVRYPFIDLAETSAGGGSIAWIDQGGALRVGPKSAGSNPGPVCYDAGGTEPTITDANLVLGRLNSEYLLAGEMKINMNKAFYAIKSKIADVLNYDVYLTALGIIKIANNHMAKIMKIVSIERGYDPRDFYMIAYGGAGPMHAVEIAADLGVKGIIIPPQPGLFSALGLVVSDLKREYMTTIMTNLDRLSDAKIENIFDKMIKKANTDFDKSAIHEGEKYFIKHANLQYFGQAYELDLPLPAGNNIKEKLADEFHKKHKRIYGYSSNDPVYLVSLRLTAIIMFKKPKMPQTAKKSENAIKSTKKVYFDNDPVDTVIYDRTALGTDAEIPGPAIIEQYDSTTIIPPKWRANIDKFSNIIIKKMR